MTGSTWQKGTSPVTDGDLTVAFPDKNATYGLKFNSGNTNYYAKIKLDSGDSVKANVCVAKDTEKSVTLKLVTALSGGTEIESLTKNCTKTATEFDFGSVSGQSSDGYYYIYCSAAASNPYLQSITRTAGTTYTGAISGTVSGITAEPTGTFKCDGTEFKLTNTDGTYSYSITGLEDGEHTITYAGTDYKMDDVIVTGVTQDSTTTQDLTLSTIPSVSNVALTITGAGNKSLTLTGQTYGQEVSVTLDSEGKYTIPSINVDTFDITITGGTMSQNTFIVTSETTALEATFEKAVAQDVSSATDEIDLGAAVAEEYPSVGDGNAIPSGDVFATYFTSYGAYKRDASQGVEVKQYGSRSFSFTTTKALKMTIGYASTSSGNSSEIAVKAEGASGNTAYGVVSGSATTDLTVDYLPAGTYRVYSPATNYDRNVQVRTIKFEAVTASDNTVIKSYAYDTPAVVKTSDAYYLVSVVEKAKVGVAGYSAVTQTAGSGTIANSDTVYKNVKIGGTTYSATDLYASADTGDYLFASKVTNDDGTDSEAVIIGNLMAVTTSVAAN